MEMTGNTEDLSDDDAQKPFVKDGAVACFEDGALHLTKNRLKEVLGSCHSMEEAKEKLELLTMQSKNLDSLVESIESKFKRFERRNEGCRLIFHAGFIAPEFGKAHYISNLSETTSDKMAELLFRNCQMSQVYRDALVTAYELCKKAGIDKGDVPKNV